MQQEKQQIFGAVKRAFEEKIFSYMKEIQQAKKEVLDAAKNAFESKMFTGTSGNLSVCIRELDIVAITPTSVRYETMTVEDVVVIDLDGNVMEGRHGPSSEHRLHCMLYKAKPEISAVIHTHSPYATAFSVLGQEIPPILVEMVLFLGGAIPCARIAMQGTDEVGQTAVDAMGSGSCCLMANHGVVTVGKDIKEAYVRAEYVEEGAQICTIARQNGEVKPVPMDMQIKLIERLKNK